MTAWLEHLLKTVAPNPALIVAAGHAAGYVLRHFSKHAEEMPPTVLVAPTWRGPFPTMLGRRPAWLARLRGAVDMPVIGPTLYALNLSRPIIRRMVTEHVYSDPSQLTPDWMAQKRAVAGAAGARFASVRFVTGALDPFKTSEAARAAAADLPAGKVELIWGEETPPKSKAEMVAMADAADVQPIVLPLGKLAIHEEFANDVAQRILVADEASASATAAGSVGPNP